MTSITRKVEVPARQTQYTIPIKFLQGSKLPCHLYLAVKEPKMIQANEFEYTLGVVLSALKQVISQERLYDPNNREVIVCSIELEKALDVKFVHVTEIRTTLLRNQLIPFISNTVNNTTKVIKPFPDNSTSLVVNR